MSGPTRQTEVFLSRTFLCKKDPNHGEMVKEHYPKLNVIKLECKKCGFIHQIPERDLT